MAKNSMVRLSNTPATLRSGVTELFSEESMYFDRSRCVSPLGHNEQFDNRLRSKKIQQHLQHVDAVMDLTKLDCDNMSGVFYQKTPRLGHHGQFVQHEPPNAKGIQKGIQLDSVKGGQTAEFDMRPTFALLEILRGKWCSSGGHKSSKSHLCEADHKSTPFPQRSDNLNNHNTMTSSPLHNGESKRCFLGRQAMESELPSRPCVSRRSRSRAIAIKRASRDENHDEIREHTAAAEYDWATWRMYNRIIDHRQKYPSNYQHEESYPGVTITTLKHEMTGSRSSIQDLTTNLATAHSAYQIQDYPEYGEVFELDM